MPSWSVRQGWGGIERPVYESSNTEHSLTDRFPYRLGHVCCVEIYLPSILIRFRYMSTQVVARVLTRQTASVRPTHLKFPATISLHVSILVGNNTRPAVQCYDVITTLAVLTTQRYVGILPFLSTVDASIQTVISNHKQTFAPPVSLLLPLYLSSSPPPCTSRSSARTSIMW